jgi:hypothetical protein
MNKSKPKNKRHSDRREESARLRHDAACRRIPPYGRNDEL